MTAADVKQTMAPGSVDSPALGYVVRTPDGGVPELRAMLGIPGAARFSDPIALPDGTTAADVAPGQAWVLAIRAGEAVSLLPDSGVLTSVAKLGTPAAWAFSPSGSRIALFYPDNGSVSLLSGLPASPKLEQTLQIAQLDALALSDNGAFVYVSGGQALNADGGVVYQAGAPLAFESGNDLLVLFDSATSNLMEVAATGASNRIIASGITAPDQLLAGPDRIYAGNSAAATVSLVEYADGSNVTVNVNVSRMLRTAVAGTVLVGVDPAGPAWLVNSQGVSFVPAVVNQVVQ